MCAREGCGCWRQNPNPNPKQPQTTRSTHLVQLNRGELGVVASADALVAEDAPNLKHTLQAAHLEDGGWWGR